jgi:tetratricopeptide (TPR) repeat protein
VALGAYKEALNDWEMASGLATPDGIYAREIGDCLLKLGDFARALQHYEEGLESGRSDGCRWGRARALAAMQQYGPAIADFEAALRADPKNAGIYSGLALAFLRTGDLKKALQVTDAGRKLYRWDGMDVAILAAVYAAHKQFDEAAALQYKALEGAKTSEEAALQARRLCSYWVQAYDGDALVAQLARLRKEAQHKRDLAERAERSAREAALREAELERSRNPYLLHEQSGAEEEE